MAYPDSAEAWGNLSDHNTRHEKVNHAAGERVRAAVQHEWVRTPGPLQICYNIT